MIVETIYAPTLKDAVSGLRQERFVGTFAAASAAATGVTSPTTFTVPSDRARFLTGFSAILAPGAAQNIVGVQLLLSIAGTFNLAVQITPPIVVAGRASYVYAQLDVTCMPGEVLSCQAVFDAGGVANSLTNGFVWGFDIPRANISA